MGVLILIEVLFFGVYMHKGPQIFKNSHIGDYYGFCILPARGFGRKVPVLGQPGF